MRGGDQNSAPRPAPNRVEVWRGQDVARTMVKLCPFHTSSYFTLTHHPCCRLAVEDRVVLEPDADWVTCPSSLLLHHSGRGFEVQDVWGSTV